MIAISFVTILTWYYIINLICGVGLIIYTAINGPVESGVGTYIFSTILVGLLLLGVLTYL